MQKPTLKDRITDPLFLLGAAGFAYQGINYGLQKYGLPGIDLGTWQLAVDLVAWAVIGTGIYHFGKQKPGE